MNGPKKAWPTDAVMIVCASREAACVMQMESALPGRCRDCGRELVVDGAVLRRMQTHHLRAGRPIMFFCRECYQQYEQPDALFHGVTGPIKLTPEYQRELLDQMLEQLDGKPLTITLTPAEALALAGLVDISALVEQQISRSAAAQTARTKLRKQLPDVCLRIVDRVGQAATKIMLRQMLFTAAQSTSRN